MSDQPNVQTALAAVIADLPAIGKDHHAAPGQGGYAYRGIEAITRNVQPLLARHGVIIVPNVLSHNVKDITVANRPWTDTTLVVEYTIVGPDGSTLTATTVGIGRDNSDKGANKAMTQAFKYLLLQLLCVSDAADDTDGTSHVADGPAEQHRPEHADRVETVIAEMRRSTATRQHAIKDWADGRSLSGGSMLRDVGWLEQVESWLDEHPDTPPEPEPVSDGRSAAQIAADKLTAAGLPAQVGMVE